MRRRSLLCTLPALILCPSIALGTQRPSPREAKHFDWLHPGVRPYTGPDDERALNMLASGGVVIPAEAHTQLSAQVRAGAGYPEQTIPNGYFFTRMLFGDSKRVSNVIARTDQWPQGATQAIVRYSYRLADKVYVLLRPSVCGNWALRVISLQGECIACVDCAQDDCEEIEREQAVLVRRGREKHH